MPFTRPTLPDLIRRTAADISSKLQIGPLLDRSVLYVLARVWSGQAHLLHGHLDFIAKQISIVTSETDALQRHASVFGITRLAPAAAKGTTRFTGLEGSPIPQGTQVSRVDGQVYSTDAAGTITGGVADVAVTAVVAGELSNTNVGVELTITTAVPNVAATTTVQDDGSGNGLSGGSDQETDDELRARLLIRTRNVPQGGAEADYIQWARFVAGVTRVWVKPIWQGPASVIVWFVRDNDSGGIFPSAGEIADVDEVIQARRPVTAAVTVAAPTPLNLDPQITLVPNTQAVQAAVTASIEDLLLREAAVEGTLLFSHLREAISNAAGETDHTITSPTSDVVAGGGELLVLGTPVYS